MCDFLFKFHRGSRSKLLNCLSISCDRELTDRVGDYTLSEERLKAFTGLTWEQLIELREMMPSMRNSENRNVTQALANSNW